MRKLKGDGEGAETVDAPAIAIPALEVMPSDAIDLGDVIDRRFKDLLARDHDAKSLTDALKAAAAWWGVKKEHTQDEGYGANRGKGTMREA